MKVGDYVRTTKGKIDRIDSYDVTFNCYHLSTEPKYCGIIEDDVIKSSPNIIDLIEVGDYVNGSPVYEIVEYEDGHNTIVLGNDTKQILWTDKYIKSIVTKEQFEAMGLTSIKIQQDKVLLDYIEELENMREEAVKFIKDNPCDTWYTANKKSEKFGDIEIINHQEQLLDILNKTNKE